MAEEELLKKFGRKSPEGRTPGKEEQVLLREFQRQYDLVPGSLSVELGAGDRRRLAFRPF